MTPAFYDLLCAIDHLGKAKRKLDACGESDLVDKLRHYIHTLDLFAAEMSEVDF